MANHPSALVADIAAAVANRIAAHLREPHPFAVDKANVNPNGSNRVVIWVGAMRFNVEVTLSN